MKAHLPINGVDLAYDEGGDGFPLLLLHAGVADMRMWDDVWPALTARYRCIRPDLRGYGDTALPDGPFTYAADMAELLRALGVARAHVIGVSMSGSVALDLALAHPELVERLVIVAAGLPGWEYSEAMQAADAEETSAFDAGDLDGAAWACVRTWLDGPSRSPDQVDPHLRRRVFEMQRRAYDWDNDKAEGGWLTENRRAHYGEITAPTLVVVGELDQGDIIEMGPVLAAEIPGSRLARMPGVAHLPPMEAPAAFVDLVEPFLDGE